jgi:Antitoxin of toxin-antitoxin, RelE / RelB, TA system
MSRMTIRHFGSYTTARTNLRDLLDAAHTGRVTTVDRDRERFAVVDAEMLRAQLAALRPSGAVVRPEGGGWSAFLPGVPVSGEGVDLDSALDDLIEALREYAADWNDRLLDAPNHRGNWALVVLTELSDDAQLKGWLLHDEISPAR